MDMEVIATITKMTIFTIQDTTTTIITRIIIIKLFEKCLKTFVGTHDFKGFHYYYIGKYNAHNKYNNYNNNNNIKLLGIESNKQWKILITKW